MDLSTYEHAKSKISLETVNLDFSEPTYIRMIKFKNFQGCSRILKIALALLLLSACTMPRPDVVHDVVIREGTIYDGTGGPPMVADLAIDGDRISALGDLSGHRGYHRKII